MCLAIYMHAPDHIAVCSHQWGQMGTAYGFFRFFIPECTSTWHNARHETANKRLQSVCQATMETRTVCAMCIGVIAMQFRLLYCSVLAARSQRECINVNFVFISIFFSHIHSLILCSHSIFIEFAKLFLENGIECTQIYWPRTDADEAHKSNPLFEIWKLIKYIYLAYPLDLLWFDVLVGFRNWFIVYKISNLRRLNWNYKFEWKMETKTYRILTGLPSFIAQYRQILFCFYFWHAWIMPRSDIDRLQST